MATYLVAVIVTDYKKLESKVFSMNRSVDLNIYYPKGKENTLELPMVVTKKVFRKLEDFFGVRYPISKLDQIGFKSLDMLPAGMENFGLITYEDGAFYGKPENKSKTAFSIAAGVICHEITHQWFGNLVTLRWWDDMWLNEGMTQYFSFWRKGWLDEYDTVTSGSAVGLLLKESKDVYDPVFVGWDREPTIHIAGFVTYEKGATVVKMLEEIMGRRNFKLAMRAYVKKFQFRSVTHVDLWNEMTSISMQYGNKYNISEIMQPWIEQPGFPIVNVKINHAGRSIEYHQKLCRFTPEEVYARKPLMKRREKYIWPLPLQWRIGTNRTSDIKIVREETGKISLSGATNKDEVFIINPSFRFYYVVNYEPSYWLKIADFMKKNPGAFDYDNMLKIKTDVLILRTETKQGRGNYISEKVYNSVRAALQYISKTL